MRVIWVLILMCIHTCRPAARWQRNKPFREVGRRKRKITVRDICILNLSTYKLIIICVSACPWCVLHCIISNPDAFTQYAQVQQWLQTYIYAQLSAAANLCWQAAVARSYNFPIIDDCMPHTMQRWEFMALKRYIFMSGTVTQEIVCLVGRW